MEGPYEAPRQQEIPFGQRSYYLAPWRAYMDTWPASRYLQCPGINFNVSDKEADAVAAVLAEAGFVSARIEVGWGSFRYEAPDQLTESAARKFAARLAACKKHGLRPLILLNANSGGPCPAKSIPVNITRAAEAGAREIFVEAIAGIIPHRTGLRGQAYQTAFPLITNADPVSGRCQLSAPLAKPIKAGRAELVTLKYAPFGGRIFADGTTNAAMTETLAGWMNYVAAICAFARTNLAASGAGPSDAGFDLEVWNEYTFGSQFLDEKNYYQPPRGFAKPLLYTRHGLTRTGPEIILPMTVDFVNAPTNGLAGVRVISGFANQRPWDNGAEMWPGQAGFSRHYYTALSLEGWDGRNGFLSPASEKNLDQPMINALGQAKKAPFFIPSLLVAMPETWHYGFKTELMTRELVPFPNPMKNHFRFAHPGDGRAAEVWMTEFNLWRFPWASRLLQETGVNEKDPRFIALMHHLGAKSSLRALVFHSHKGVQTINLYAAKESDKGFAVLPGAFFEALKAENYQLTPAVKAQAGEQVAVLARMKSLFKDGQPLDSPRPVSLLKLVEHRPHLVFKGDGTPAHPDRYHRHDFACLPFQMDASQFAIGYYVVTRNVAHEWDRSKDRLDPARYRLPDQTFDLTLGNLRGEGAGVTVFDPLTGQTLPAVALSATPTSLTVRLPATDYPRFLRLQESRPGPQIIAPKFVPAAKPGDGALTFQLNGPHAGEIWLGPWPHRNAEGPLRFARAVQHELDMPLVSTNCGVRVVVYDGGLSNVWPRWPHDVAGVVWSRQFHQKEFEAASPVNRLPALKNTPPPANFNLQLPPGWQLAGNPPGLRLGEGATAVTMTLQRVMIRASDLAQVFPPVTALDDARFESIEWAGEPAWRAEFEWSAVARPGLRQTRQRLLVAPLKDGYLVMDFNGSPEGFQQHQAAMEKLAGAVKFE